MSTPVLPAQDRAGRVYKPAIGSRLRPLLWIILDRLRPAGGQRVLPLQRDRAHLVPGDHSADVLLYDHGCLASVSRPFSGHPVPGLRLRAPGNLVEAAQPGGDPLRPGSSGRGTGHRGLGIRAGADRRFRGPRHADPQHRLLVSRVAPLAAVALYVKHRLAGPRIRWEWARRFGGAGRRLRRRDGPAPLAGPPVVRRQGAEGGQAVLLPVRGGHGQRQVHPGRDADDGRLLPEVPQGRLRRLVPLVAPLQLVQQQGLPDRASARPARSSLERDGKHPGRALVRGLPRPRAVLLGRVRRPQLRRREQPHEPGGHHLHGLPRDHHVNSTRGNADYTIEEPQHYPFAFSDNPVLQVGQQSRWSRRSPRCTRRRS